jgi:hypothetical protein
MPLLLSPSFFESGLRTWHDPLLYDVGTSLLPYRQTLCS